MGGRDGATPEVALGNLFTEGAVGIEASSKHPAVQFAVTVKRESTIEPAEATDWWIERGLRAVPRTKVVRVVPGFVFANHLGCTLELGQPQPAGGVVSVTGNVVVEPKTARRLDFQANGPKLLQLREPGENTWSGGFHATELNVFCMWVGERLARVAVQCSDGGLFITVSPEPTSRMLNTTADPVLWLNNTRISACNTCIMVLCGNPPALLRTHPLYLSS